MTIIDVVYLVPVFRNFYASCGQAVEYKNISGNRFAIQIIVFVADSLNVLLLLLVRFNNLICRRGFASIRSGVIKYIIGKSVDKSFPRISVSDTDVNKWFQFVGYLYDQGRGFRTLSQ